METKQVNVPEPKELWNYIVEHGKEVEKGTEVNSFDDNDIATIIASMEFHGATEIWLRQTYFDLHPEAKPFAPRFRLFDWLAMCVMSRNDDDRKQNRMALRVLVYAWLKVNGNPKAFIDDLRYTDYQMDESWSAVKFSDEEETK